MSEFKGMKIYMAVDSQEDGAFFIKKSILDGSLAVFDEENDATSQVKRNADSTELREGFIVRPETKEKIESEIERLTAIATKQAARANELYVALGSLLDASTRDITEDELHLACEIVRKIYEKSRIEAEQENG